MHVACPPAIGFAAFGGGLLGVIMLSLGSGAVLWSHHHHRYVCSLQLS